MNSEKISKLRSQSITHRCCTSRWGTLNLLPSGVGATSQTSRSNLSTLNETAATMVNNPSDLDSFFRDLSPKELRAALATFVPPNSTYTERVSAIEAVLNSPNGVSVRIAMGRWISEHIVPASKLVPAAHVRWIPVIRDAMLYVVCHLSASRLAPKLLEQ